MLVAIADPQTPRDRLASLTLGQRDRRLLDLRLATFGDRLRSRATCPNCDERLEFMLLGAEIAVDSDAAAEAGEHHDLTVDGYALTFRVPDSRDLASAATAGSVAEARRTLLSRCLVSARHGRKTMSVADLPESIVVRMAERIAAVDSQAEVLIDLACPACESRWQLQFDIATYFWAEISHWVGRLLEEVHVLASAYGWSETDILSMPATRRRLYREFVGA
jgi:hypothetical protein